MIATRINRAGLAALTAVSLSLSAGCENLPGGKKEQGAVIGGAGGALAGGTLAEDNRALGALIGGLLGAGGGYLVGTELDKNEEEARDAAREARQNPASADEVERSNTADLDGNGFVTMDELIAMKQANISGDEIINRAEATDQVFQLSRQQENELVNVGYDRDTLNRLEQVNRDVVERYEQDQSERVSQPRG